MLLRHLFMWSAAMVPTLLSAQLVLHGRVVDGTTLEPLAFVHMVVADAREGTWTDIDGRFELNVRSLPATVRLGYVGYEPMELPVSSTAHQVIRLQRATQELAAVEILPGEDPAHRIVRRVYANRKVNDGMRHRSHRYTSYSKTVFTAEVDSALLLDPARMAALDSSTRDAIDFFDEQHILLIESATSKRFIPPAAEKEEVLAMRVSGLKDPSLLALAASTKTFSIYDPQIILNEKSYLSPIGPNSVDQYLFILEDTLFQGMDSVYVLSYRPRKGKKFDGLKGVLYVNTNGYALQNVIAEPVDRTGLANIKLQQQHEFIAGKAWFPVQLNTYLYFDAMKVNDMNVIGIGRTYLSDIEVDADVERREVRGPELEMDRIAMRRDDAYWAALRKDTLNAKELRTYHVIDSIGEEFDLDRKLKWLSYLTTGRLPIGPVDVRLFELFRYNGHEGMRAGWSITTNDRVSRYAAVGGYFAYGFKDEAWKYGGDLRITPRPGRELELRLYAAEDVVESGGVRFKGGVRPLSNENYRFFYMDRMDRIRHVGAELSLRVNSSLKLWFGTERAERTNESGYRYARPLDNDITYLSNSFLTGGVSLGLRFAFREQMARLPDRQITLGTRWPVLHVNAYNAFDGLWQGRYAVWRANAMLEKRFHVRRSGDLHVRAIGGIADREAPYPFLFNLRGTWSDGLAISVENTFETMRPNEFLADRYTALHVRHAFGRSLWKGRNGRGPEPSVVASAGWGGLAHPERHLGYTIKSLEGGYYEAGLILDRVIGLGLLQLGVGGFYRLGMHAFPDPVDNITVKLSLRIGTAN
ncbi:MAG: DUF5686 family protein [Flavobacteriales bacterium]